MAHWQREPMKSAIFAHFRPRWPWPWIESYGIPSCVTRDIYLHTQFSIRLLGPDRESKLNSQWFII